EVWSVDRKTILFVTHDVEEAIVLSDRIYVMSPRPGHLYDCIAVDLPRPRTVEITLGPRFLAVKRRLLDRLSAMQQRCIAP
ncbi:MAG TPA: ABC transporter ATP-binding protein, partial [Chloroflexota bacterium]|nr:ABC transporter ATP-binding protein [Chloroflexota bacterium]